MWYYNNVELIEVPEKMIGFVYCITNLKTGKKYIGKKNFWSTRRVKSTKRKNKKKVTNESNWREYFGSNANLISDVETHGSDYFKREVIRLCQSKSEMSYYEIKEQIDREVIFQPENYYNNFIGCRIHGAHMRPK